jgi:ubiquinone/menaquinone biosynthesis C-methylase UbiE
MSLIGTLVALEIVTPNVEAEEVYQRALRVHKNDKAAFDKKYQPYEWARLTYAMRTIKPCKSVLDIGVGRGYLVNMLQWSKKFEKVSGIDIIAHNQSKFAKGVAVSVMDVRELEFPDNAFDTVICMEVLEHMPEKETLGALAELRRVARNQLIVTVPFMEPEPIAPYHKRRFTEDDVKTLFPKARYSLLLKSPINRVPWLMIDEQY